MLKRAVAEARKRLQQPSMQIVALRTCQSIVNPISQLILVARFGVAEYGIYAAAQALALALERLITLGVADFSVREMMLQGENRHWTFKALYASRVVFFLIVSVIVLLVLDQLGVSEKYLQYFIIFWMMEFCYISNRMILSLLRSMRRLREIRAVDATFLGIDVMALLGVAFLGFGYLEYLLVRLTCLALLCATTLWLYRAYFAGLLRHVGKVYAEFRRTVQLSSYFALIALLRELTANWLTVLYSTLVDPAIFGIFTMLNRFSRIINTMVNAYMNTISYPRLVQAVQWDKPRFTAAYDRMRRHYAVLALGGGALFLAALMATEHFVFAADESFGWLLILLGVLRLIVNVQIMIPIKLIVAAGRAKDRILPQMLIVVISYTMMLLIVQVWPLGALVVTHIFSTVVIILLLRPLIRDIKRKVGKTV